MEAARKSVLQIETVNSNAVLSPLHALCSQILMSVTMKPSVGTTATARTQMAPSAASVTKDTPTHQEI